MSNKPERRRRRRRRGSQPRRQTKGRDTSRQPRQKLTRHERRVLKTAGGWPLHEVLITGAWREPLELVQILVARRGDMGQIAAGAFLVDLACLGVKSASAHLFRTQVEYEATVRARLMSNQRLVPSNLNLAAKIIREGVAYAGSLGFSPDPDFQYTRTILGEADPDAAKEDVPVGGPDGKPYFFAGPDDKVDVIMERLTQAVGPDGFEYTVPVDLDDMDWDLGDLEPWED
jgi:hypothetical protein